jgi:EAL domain-containing protein (putative c-di-GMP-specific phosphodiesterase class I)
MLPGLDRKRYKQGDTIFRHGEEGDCAYLIESGKVDILSPDNGRVISCLGVDDLFGEVALIDRSTRTASAVAAQDVSLVEIKRELIDELLKGTDPVICHLLRLILQRFRSRCFTQEEAARDNDKPREESVDPLQQLANYKLMLSHDISHALARDQFELFYQPIIVLATGKIAGFEALVRWQHPTLGRLPPFEFLALAEKTGQIKEIGLWTIEQACRDWPRLRQMTDFERPFVSVNLSGKQLEDPNFARNIMEIQTKANMPPGELKLELTETTFIEQPDLAVILLNEILTRGNSLALDDYGTGYSSLDYLQRYPIKTLKLDRIFISKMIDSKVSFELVKGSLDMARALCLDTVAEGIEGAELHEQLTSLGCEFGQGYFLASRNPSPI